MALNYTVDKKITDLLSEKNFTVSAEVVPPRNGQEPQKILAQLESLVNSKISFMSVTKGAGGSLRGGSLPIAQTIKENFKTSAIAHFTCRDLVPQEIESLLIDHHYFGIRNILALRGDPPMGDNSTWTPRDGGYNYAYELIKQIKALNEGTFLKRDGYKVDTSDKTDFCIGAAVYPEHPIASERLEFAARKFEEGAEYGITQMIFDPLSYDNFLNESSARIVNKPILPGLRILKSQKQAGNMTKRFGCSVPKWYFDALPEKYDESLPVEVFLEPFYKLVDHLKNAGAPGVHIFVLSDTVLCSKAIEFIQKEFQ